MITFGTTNHRFRNSTTFSNFKIRPSGHFLNRIFFKKGRGHSFFGRLFDDGLCAIFAVFSNGRTMIIRIGPSTTWAVKTFPASPTLSPAAPPPPSSRPPPSNAPAEAAMPGAAGSAKGSPRSGCTPVKVVAADFVSVAGGGGRREGFVEEDRRVKASIIDKQASRHPETRNQYTNSLTHTGSSTQKTRADTQKGTHKDIHRRTHADAHMQTHPPTLNPHPRANKKKTPPNTILCNKKHAHQGGAERAFGCVGPAERTPCGPCTATPRRGFLRRRYRPPPLEADFGPVLVHVKKKSFNHTQVLCFCFWFYT